MTAILFDYGATLDTFGQHWGMVIWHGYEHLGIPVTEAQYRDAYVYGERTLGSKDLTSRLKSSFYCGIKGNKLSGKINIKAGKGWKLENIFLFDNHNPGKQIKNGSKVTLKKGSFLNITLKDKNGIPNDLTVDLY